MEFVRQLQPIAQDGITILNYLLPGLLASWVVYALTDFKRPAPFDQVIYALLALLLVQAAAAIVGAGAHWLGQWVILGPWTSTSDFVASVFLAIGLGLAVARAATSPAFYQRLRDHGWRLRRADTPVWSDSFDTSYVSAEVNRSAPETSSSLPGRWVTLTLADERRILGWPRRYPADGSSGHVALTRAKWLVIGPGGEQSEIVLDGVQEVLIPVGEIKRVEFLEEYDHVARMGEKARESPGTADANAITSAAAAARANPNAAAGS